MKRLLVLFIMGCMLFSACTDTNKSKVLAEQDKMIREVYPDRIQTGSWENYVKYPNIAARHFADDCPPMADPFFSMLWKDAKAKGYYQKVYDKVKETKDSVYAVSYTDFLFDYYSDYYEEVQPHDIELMYRDFQSVGRYLICPSAEDILEYAMGRVKYNMPKPIITGTEHIDDNQHGEGGYWIVHFQDGDNRKVRFYQTDDGKMEFDRIRD